MKMNKMLLGFFLGILITPLLAWSLLSESSPRTAYVDLQQLFDQFAGKKELEGQLLQWSNMQQKQLDSLQLQLKALENHIATHQNIKQATQLLESRSQQFEQLRFQFEQTYTEKSEQFTQAVWQQINQYVKDYGDEKNYDYIYGSGGDGTLMYARPQNDMTTSILQYMNMRYEDL